MPDKFEDLSTYIAILDAGGINAAAAELGIAKSAVSRRLSDLERRLGASLVDRSGRRLEPTAVGIEYARRARSLLAALDELDRSVGSGREAQVVTILADREVIAHLLLPALARLEPSSRDLTIRLLERAAPDDAERVDIHVSSEGAAGRGRAIGTTAHVLCASPGFLRENGSPDGRKEAADGRRMIGVDGSSPPPGLVIPDVDLAAAAAVAGLGFARLPDFVAAPALADGSLVKVPDGREPAPVDVLAWCDDEASPAARRLFDLLVALTR